MSRITPEIGKTCPALTNENYEYHLSGDAADHCKCTLNDLPCKGRVVVDPEDKSSQFFSRGKCMIDTEKIKECPLYGASAETIKGIAKERLEKEMNDKLNEIK